MSNTNDYHAESNAKHNNNGPQTEKSENDTSVSTPGDVDPATTQAPELVMLGRLMQMMSHSNTLNTTSTASSDTAAENAGSQPPETTPETALSELLKIFDDLMHVQSKIPQLANREIPTATIPSDFRKVERPTAEGPLYNSLEYTKEGVGDLLGMVKDAFLMMDKMAGHDSTSSTSSPETSSAGRLAKSFILSDTENGGTQSEQPPLHRDLAAVELNAVTRLYQTNERMIYANLKELVDFFITVPEDDDNYPMIESSIGITLLHLYEVNWENDVLEFGCEWTARALQKLSQLPEVRQVRLAPILVRCWAYGQRLLVQTLGNIERLEASLALLKNSWGICNDFPEIPSRVMEFLRTELGFCLADHYRCTGNLDSLNECIVHLLALTEDKPTPTAATVVLGLAYYDRFMHSGALDDLDRALARGIMCSQIVVPPATEHQDYAADKAAGHRLYALALSERFKMTMDIDDLNKAVKHGIKALGLLHPSHPLRVPYTVDLATILYSRHLAVENGTVDLRTALESVQTAITAADNDIGRHSRIPAESTIGFLTAVSSEVNRDLSGVDAGISIIQKSRKNFSALLCRFRLGKNVEDFETALHHAQLAFDKAPEDSPYRHQCGLELGQLLIQHYLSGRSETCDDAIAHFVSVALSSTWPSLRLNAAIEWANAVELSEASEGAEDALVLALEILPTLAPLTNRIPAHYRVLSSQKASIPNRAAIYALNSSDIVSAVSRLEQGRNIMWTQTLQLKAGHMLPGGDERQREFKLLSENLMRTRHGSTMPETVEELDDFMKHVPDNPFGSLPDESVRESFQDIAKRLMNLGKTFLAGRRSVISEDFNSEFMSTSMDASLHSAANRWSTLHSELQGTSHVLGLSETYEDDLNRIIANGCIVILSPYSLRCDAIVIHSRGEGLVFHHLPLPELSGDEIQAWAETLRSATHEFERGKLSSEDFENEYLKPILRGLWTGMALPLLDYLKRTGEQKRVWWYPTGASMFLPLHAASPCEKGQLGLLDLVVSSYIPSIQSLIRAAKSPSSPVKALAVGLPNTPGYAPLKFVEKEIKALKKHFYYVPDQLTTLIGEEADIYPVISKLPDHSCIHLSCHAYQDEEYPFNSSFFLNNGKLKLSKLMELDLSRVQFAFLSACLTSAGDASVPDECIHLAAGMQFSGVQSVIGTMWSVMDRAAAAASTKVYSHFFRNGMENANMREGAEALHEALIDMQKRNYPLTYIVPFIHLGL
uniref:CHAT domain-containing protein n=1 Tax=Psilocybe cubensis TaxID=181762 RepID=A0A8H8CDF7_PSICU